MNHGDRIWHGFCLSCNVFNFSHSLVQEPYMSTLEDVVKLIAEREVAFVDFRFTDTLGKEHHLTIPAHTVDEEKLETGVAFDGSSIAGWKGIEASDMVLIPDAKSARMDPFREEPTLNLTCDVVEPSDLKGYDRDPRSLA